MVTPPARTTVPSLAVMTPELATCGATSAASPACLTVIWPWFTTAAFGFAASSSASWPPLMNVRTAVLLLPEAVTIRPAVLTCEPL